MGFKRPVDGLEEAIFTAGGCPESIRLKSANHTCYKCPLMICDNAHKVIPTESERSTLVTRVMRLRHPGNNAEKKPEVMLFSLINVEL